MPIALEVVRAAAPSHTPAPSPPRDPTPLNPRPNVRRREPSPLTPVQWRRPQPITLSDRGLGITHTPRVLRRDTPQGFSAETHPSRDVTLTPNFGTPRSRWGGVELRGLRHPCAPYPPESIGALRNLRVSSALQAPSFDGWGVDRRAAIRTGVPGVGGRVERASASGAGGGGGAVAWGGIDATARATGIHQDTIRKEIGDLAVGLRDLGLRDLGQEVRSRRSRSCCAD